MPAPPSGNLLDVFDAREVPYLARLRQNPGLLRLREQIHMPMVVLSANRPKQTYQGRPVHNECELACAVGRGRKDPPPPTTLPRRVFRSAPTHEPPVGGKEAVYPPR